ncbi:MAG: ABC-type transport system involved in cytochrome c biogenesis permease component [Candidatus Midichloriaceae bacterium]
MTKYTKHLTPDAISVFSSVFFRQIRLALSNKANILNSLFLFLLSLMIINFIISDKNIDVFRVFEILFIIYSVILSIDTVLVEDYKKGVLEQFLLSGVALEIFLLSKIVSSIIIYTILYIPILFCVEIIEKGFSFQNQGYDLLLKFIIIFNIVINSIFASAFLLSHKHKISQILISMIINLPTIIIYVICYKYKELYYLVLLVAMFLISFSVSMLLSSHIIKISIEES